MAQVAIPHAVSASLDELLINLKGSRRASSSKIWNEVPIFIIRLTICYHKELDEIEIASVLA